MTRTEAIAKAISEVLLQNAAEINTLSSMHAIFFEVRLKPGTTTVLRTTCRPELGRDYAANGRVE